MSQKRSPVTHERSGSASKAGDRKGPAFDLRSLESCTVNASPPPPRDGRSTKPLWFPGHPNSIEDNMIKDIVKEVTGLQTGARSYYASSKQVKRCFAQQSETVACILVHPIIDMSPGPDEKTDQYNLKFVMVLRNPLTALPAHFNWKRHKYHKKEGQTPIDEWRQIRDEHLEGMMGAWKLMLTHWKGLEKLSVGMYLTHEEIMDPKRGPFAIQRLSALFAEEDFPTLPNIADDDDTATCVWYQSVGREALEIYQRYRYEYQDYFPGYTQGQLEFLSKELSGLVEDYSDDDDLVTILKQYQDQIASSAIDKEWVNKTSSSS